MLAQGEDIVPIRGTKRRIYLGQNLGALDVILSDDELSRIDEILPPGSASGLRYTAIGVQAVNR